MSTAESMAAAYARDGFITPITILDESEARQWRRAYEDAEKIWRGIDDPLRRRSVGGFPHLTFPAISAMVTDSRITDVVAQVLGEDLLCWNLSFWTKEPGTDAFVSWHQDLNYWGLDEADEVTAWVALSPATLASGCMQFARGSHQTRLAHSDTFHADNMLTRGQEIEVDIDPADCVDVVLAPGQMSLHHGLLCHASGPNTSDDRRIGLAIRYIKPSMRQVHGENDLAILVRGEDRYGHFRLIDPPTQTLAEADIQNCIYVTRHHDRILYRGTDKAPQ